MNATAFKHIVAALFAAKWVHWENHWHSMGSNYYGDHLLYERIYSEIDDQIDGLMEKWIVEGDVSEMESIISLAHKGVTLAKQKDPPHERSLAVEKLILKAINLFFGKMEDRGTLSLGLNDYLASLHSKHETSVYLLTQRSKKASAEKVQYSVELEGHPTPFSNPSFYEVLQLAEAEESNEGNVAEDAPDLPPTPEEIIEEEPNSDTLSTLSRLEVV